MRDDVGMISDPDVGDFAPGYSYPCVQSLQPDETMETYPSIVGVARFLAGFTGSLKLFESRLYRSGVIDDF